MTRTIAYSLWVEHIPLWGLESDRLAADNELSLIIGDSTLRCFASYLQGRERGGGGSNYCTTEKSHGFLSVGTDAES